MHWTPTAESVETSEQHNQQQLKELDANQSHANAAIKVTIQGISQEKIQVNLCILLEP